MPIGKLHRDESGTHARVGEDTLDAIAVANELEETRVVARGLPTPLAPPMRAMLDTPLARVDPEPTEGSLGVLTVLRGCDVGRAYALDAEVVVIGRAPTCEIWIDDASVSRSHARIAMHGDLGRYAIEDLGSTNGTFVGERRIERGEHVPLANGAR